MKRNLQAMNDELPPGRELDQKIALEVMNLGIMCICERWVDSVFISLIDGTCPDCNKKQLPHFSTSISAAWEIVEHFRKRGDVILDYYYSDIDHWRCSFGRGVDFSKSDTAPHAICLASLKAIAK